MSQQTAISLTEKLGAGEAIAAFAAEAEVIINQMEPLFSVESASLQGFIRAAWPYDGEPADAACEFVNAVREQQANTSPEAGDLSPRYSKLPKTQGRRVNRSTKGQ